ncbi:MAG: hypothetical protein KJ065_06025 [Anaerolineae bacterium]|nr:hypothetical protein [Anaerolineae bacterium]
MTELFKHIVVVVTGSLLIFNGIRIIREGRFEIGIGGRATSRPLLVLPIKGTGALAVGVSSIISGLATLVFLALTVVAPDQVSLDTSFSIGILAVGGMLLVGLMIGFVLQLIEELITVVGKNSGKNRD